MRLSPLVAVLAISLRTLVHADDSGLLAEGAKVEQLSDGYLFTEGPAADREGNVFFTDQPNDRIVKYTAADG